MSHVAHQYSRFDFYSSLEVNLSLYYGGVLRCIVHDHPALSNAKKNMAVVSFLSFLGCHLGETL